MFPKFALIRQNYPADHIADPEAEAGRAVQTLGAALEDLRGKTVGIAVGSRGISNLPAIVKGIVAAVRASGGAPVIFAAMGSHGGGTDQGQREILSSLGITEAAVGAPVRTCAESIRYGEAENGMEVFGNPLALSFDKVILVNRIKPHTDFEDITESGIYKLMAIGIGNPRGADQIHAQALRMGYGPAIRAAGAVILRRLPVAFAVAITENWKHETDSIEAILPQDLLEAETRILKRVKSGQVHLPVDGLDALIVQEAGKNISGTCIDTKVVGRIMIAGQAEPERPNIKVIAVLDFTDESHGNSMGLGIADLITRKVFDKIDIQATSLTGITSKCLLQAKIPCVAPNDRQAIETAFAASGAVQADKIRAIIIKDTNSLDRMYVSQAVYEALKDNVHVERLSDFFELGFDEDGGLAGLSATPKAVFETEEPTAAQ